jgi:hypothetical protein
VKDLPALYDGDTGPIYRFKFKDGASVMDLSSIAVEFYVYDSAGNFLVRRAGLPVSPKSGGQIDLMLLGRETDWDGAGATLVLKPKIYAAVSPTGAAATNLLVNPSFDLATGTVPARLPDSWTLVGARTATWDNYANDAWPPSIFGTFQLCNHAALTDPDYIQQQPAISLAIGDRLSVGVWHRINGNPSDASGGVKNNNHAIFFRCGTQANSIVQFEVGNADWYFASGSVVTPTVESACTFGIDGRGTTSSNRWDDAFCFKGDWRVTPVEAMRIVVRARRRTPKTGGNIVAGVGGFESDSNLDGLADGWRLLQGGTHVYSIDRTPANVSSGKASQKVVLGNSTGITMDYIKRGRFDSGETWTAKIKLKTAGALTGSPSATQWGVKVKTDNFDGGPSGTQGGTFTSFGMNVATFTEYTSSITLAKSVSALVIEINLNAVAGTAWFDDVVLTRS